MDGGFQNEPKRKASRCSVLSFLRFAKVEIGEGCHKMHVVPVPLGFFCDLPSTSEKVAEPQKQGGTIMSRKAKKRVAGRCDACGKEWVAHLGVIGTCARLQEETKRKIELEADLAIQRQYATKLFAALHMIRKFGGRTVGRKGVQNVECNGQWCASLARDTLDDLPSIAALKDRTD